MDSYSFTSVCLAVVGAMLGGGLGVVTARVGVPAINARVGAVPHAHVAAATVVLPAPKQPRLAIFDGARVFETTTLVKDVQIEEPQTTKPAPRKRRSPLRHRPTNVDLESFFRMDS
jgi:hypothetical protein